MNLRIATYNVHRCIGPDGVRDSRRVLSVVGSIQADLIALQEVESDGAHGSFTRQLAAETGYRIEFGPAMRQAGTDYGNLLLTRLPVLSVRRLDLGMPGREPRGAILTLLDLNGMTILACATHLGLRGVERRMQVDRLIREIRSEETDRPAMKVLMGDINEWVPFSRVLRRMRRSFGSSPAPATWPSSWPLLALDRIWIHPAPQAASYRVHRHVPAVSASDHLPLVVDCTVG